MENIGATTKNAVIRQKISKKIGNPCSISSILSTSLSDVFVQVVQNIECEIDERAQYPRSEKNDRDEYGYDLRHEGERLLLNMRRRLEDADDQTDCQPDDEHRRARFQYNEDGLAGQSDNKFRAHRLPVPFARSY